MCIHSTVSIYASVFCVSVYFYISRSIQKETDRERERETDKKTETKREERQPNADKERERERQRSEKDTKRALERRGRERDSKQEREGERRVHVGEGFRWPPHLGGFKADDKPDAGTSNSRWRNESCAPRGKCQKRHKGFHSRAEDPTQHKGT